MKIIKKGKINNIVTCDFCECEYEFDINDIKKESCTSYSITLNVSNNTHEYKYVECPCCCHKHYLQKPQKIYEDSILRSIPIVKGNTSTKSDKIIYKSGEVTLKDKITGSIDDTLTPVTKVECNNGK